MYGCEPTMKIGSSCARNLSASNRSRRRDGVGSTAHTGNARGGWARVLYHFACAYDAGWTGEGTGERDT